jgi:dTDP-4-amino-4,6-dideoxygalactose transaminase
MYAGFTPYSRRSSLKVPVFDITRQNNMLEDSLAEAFRTVLNNGQFILGKEVELFEEKMAQYLDAGNAIGVANGSDALLLSLLALGIGSGDEVIVPGFTFFATAGAVSRTGATPVFVDVTAGDYNIDPEQIRVNITEKTKAIIPVHLFGMPAAMESILAIAKEHNLAVVEDCAQALGSTCDGQPVGTFGDTGCFSFFPTKNLGAFGDGGLLVTNRPDLAQSMRMLRAHGAKQKYNHELLGFNSRLDALQAALLRTKLPYLNQWIKLRRKIAATYRQELQNVKEIKLPRDSEDHTYNQFTIATAKRDGLRNFLKENGVETTIYYPLALHLQPVFRPLKYKDGSLPVSEKLTRQVLSLPIFPELTESEQSYVINKIKQFFAGSGS